MQHASLTCCGNCTGPSRRCKLAPASSFDRLLTGGIRFESPEDETAPEFARHVRTHFESFTRDFIASLWVQGFVAYTIVPKRRGKNQYPYPRVLPHQSIDVEFAENEFFEVEYRVRRRSAGLFDTTTHDSYVKRSYVYASQHPTPDGQCNSLVATLWRSCAFKSMLELSAVVAEELRANPGSHPPSSAGGLDERDMDGAGIVPGFGRRRTKNMTVRNRITAVTSRLQRDLVRALNSTGTDSSTDAWKERVDPVTACRFSVTNSMTRLHS